MKKDVFKLNLILIILDISFIKKKKYIFFQLFSINFICRRKILNDIAKILKEEKKLTTAMFIPQHKSKRNATLKSDYVFCYNI